MRTRVAVLTVVFVLLATIVAVQLADPRFGGRKPPDVDFSDPPAKIAANAASQFEYVDYAYRIDISKNRSAEWRQVRTMEVDNTDHEYYKTGLAGGGGVVLYGTDAITFVRPTGDSPWRVTPIPDTLYPAIHISEPFFVNRLRASNASIVSENSSMMVIHVDVHALKVAANIPGNATLYIDKQTALIEYATVTYKPDPSRTLRLRFILTRTNIDVTRPDDIGFSPREVIWDALRGPVFHPPFDD